MSDALTFDEIMEFDGAPPDGAHPAPARAMRRLAQRMTAPSLLERVARQPSAVRKAANHIGQVGALARAALDIIGEPVRKVGATLDRVTEPVRRAMQRVVPAVVAVSFAAVRSVREALRSVRESARAWWRKLTERGRSRRSSARVGASHRQAVSTMADARLSSLTDAPGAPPVAAAIAAPGLMPL